MALFKVIVVGGSISGLALANMLEQYGIDYVVLEKHDVIAPQLGAGFAILPNGARVLEQLGCYEALEKNNEPVNSLENYDEHGTLLGSQPDMGDWMQQSYVGGIEGVFVILALTVSQVRVQDAVYGSAAGDPGSL